MEKCSKKSKQLCLSLFKPSVMMLTTGFLCMASFQGLAAVEPSHNYGPNVESVMQNGKTITVKVSDSMGELIGANVLVKGTTIGNVTDMNGSVTLQDVPANAVLEISYIGYTTKEVPVGSQSVINVTLSEDSQALEEVVVVGYGTMEKKQVTSSVTSLSAGDMMKGVGGADITSSLQGKISGLILQNNGSANGTTTIQLRGLTSINSGKAPLIVVDGFPGGDIRALNQDDIKSIDVLKDASAGAIYGTRAASGVILITTKSGSNTNGKVKLNYSTELSKKQNYGRPDMMTADEYRNRTDVNITDYGQNADWWDALLQKDNFSQKHHLSLELGTENAQVYTSFFYETNEGITIKDNRKDYGGRLNANFKLFDGWLEIRPIVDYRQTARTSDGSDEDKKANFKQALYNNPTRSPFDPESPTGYNVWTGETLDYNIVADRMLTDYEGLDKWFKPEVTMKLNIKPIEGLSYSQTLGYENRQWELHQFRSRYHRDEVTNNRGGWAKLEFSKTEHLTSEGYFTYLKEFKGGHSLNAVAGYSYFEKNGENFNAENYDFGVEGLKYWDLGAGSYLTDGKAAMGSGKNITERLFALYARANYSYNDKYMVSATIRHEGSSKFAAENRWGNFWALSGGWRVSAEEFMKEFDWVSDLKVRFGYGVTGNSAITPYQTKGGISSLYYPFGPNPTQGYIAYENEAGITNTLANQNLGWEKTAQWNIGVDFNFFNGRINGIVDVYTSKTTDLLMAQSIPTLTGYARTYANVGKTKNFGYDLTFNFVPVRTKDFEWNIGVNAAYSRNEIVSLANGKEDDPANGWFIGESTNSIYTYESAGLWKEEDRADMEKFNANGHDFQIGMARPVDQNGDYKIDANNARTIVGHFDPRWTLGLNTNFTYKGWDLGIQLYGRMGFKYYDSSVWVGGRYNVRDYDYYNENNKNAAHPKPIYDEGGKDAYYNETYLKNGSYLKIRNISLGYTFPNRLLTHTGLSALRMYAQIKNPGYIFSGCKTLDLDTYSNTYNSGFTFGLNLSF